MFSERDRKVVIVLIPLLLVGAFAFLVMKPKREEAAHAAKRLSEQRQKYDGALAQEEDLRLAKADFVTDYASVVRLGKAVPSSVDMPSVLVQLERAARGTGIEFGKIGVGERIPAAGGATASGSPSSSSAKPVEAGGAPAQSGAGQATESANNAGAKADSSTAAREKASPETNTQTSTSSEKGGVPVGGGSAASTTAGEGATAGAPAPGLDRVPLQLTFKGDFFSLADLFHQLKRFVRVVNEDVDVKGRLMTIESFGFSSAESFPKIEAEVAATIYLSPETEGATGGASPTGPGGSSGATATASGGATSPSQPSTATTPAGSDPPE